jgi:hypothetical protein
MERRGQFTDENKKEKTFQSMGEREADVCVLQVFRSRGS